MKETPIDRLRAYIVNAGLWSQDEEKALAHECTQAVEQAVDDYLRTPAQAVHTMFDHLYAELPSALRPQYEEVAKNDQS